MTSGKIHYTKPSITAREIELVTDAVSNGWGEHCYDYIVQFEDLFSQHIGTKHVIATSSCTGALHLGLSGLGIGAGDEEHHWSRRFQIGIRDQYALNRSGD